jgi:hypothetical protein
MSKHIRVENNEVVQCLDYLPENATGDWRIAVEIEPILVSGRQIRGSHTFDLNKDPVEIVWSVIDLTIDDRKISLLEQLNNDSYQLVSVELLKEFNGEDSNFVFVQQAIQAYRTKRSQINSLTTHEEIDTFILENS